MDREYPKAHLNPSAIEKSIDTLYMFSRLNASEKQDKLLKLKQQEQDFIRYVQSSKSNHQGKIDSGYDQNNPFHLMA